MIQIDDIKVLRKKFNLTQGELAKKAGVSQSLIAKIESKRLDPAYSKAQKIVSTLEHLENKNEVKISDIMNKKIISLKPNDNIKDAIKKMKSHNISQLPVIENGIAVGIITESNILESFSKIEEPKKISELTVKDIMDEPPPLIPVKTSQKVAASFLKHFQMLLITKEGKIIGILTKSDMLNRII